MEIFSAEKLMYERQKRQKLSNELKLCEGESRKLGLVIVIQKE